MSLNTVIVGAGISGLATALTLAKKGHNVKVLEHSKILRTNGGDIHLWANATRFFIDMGIEESMRPVVFRSKALAWYRYSDTKLVSNTSLVYEGNPYP